MRRPITFMQAIHSCSTYTNRYDSSTDGLLVPMVGWVPIEKDVIPMVLLVNIHVIKDTYMS